MEHNPDVEKILKLVSDELKDWKVLMEDLAGAFYRQFPATRRSGWTLHLKRCAEAKGCDMCPHSIYWVRYYYVMLSERKKKEMRRAGKEPSNSRLSWDNTKSGISRDGLPARIKLTRGDKRSYRKYEAARAEIMYQHKTLANVRKKLLAHVRNRNKDLRLPLQYFDDPVLKDYFMAVLPSKPIKIAVIRKIQELRKV